MEEDDRRLLIRRYDNLSCTTDSWRQNDIKIGHRGPAPETPFGPGILVKFPNWAWQSFCPRSPPSPLQNQIVNSSIIVSVRQMKVTKETSLDYSI